jgi:hypothetical protein
MTKPLMENWLIRLLNIALYVTGVMILGIIKMLETLLKSYTTTISQHMAKKKEPVETAKKNRYDDVGWC